MEVVKDDSVKAPVITDQVKDKNGKVIPAWQVEVQTKLFNARKAAADKKFAELVEHYNGKLKAMLDMYFAYYSSSEEENTISFNILNKEWQDLTYYCNSTQKLIELKHDAFAKNVKDVVDSEGFKASLKEQDATVAPVEPVKEENVPATE